MIESLTKVMEDIPEIPSRGLPWRKVYGLIGLTGVGLGTAVGTTAWGGVENGNKNAVLVEKVSLEDKNKELESQNKELENEKSELKQENKSLLEKVKTTELEKKQELEKKDKKIEEQRASLQDHYNRNFLLRREDVLRQVGQITKNLLTRRER